MGTRCLPPSPFSGHFFRRNDPSHLSRSVYSRLGHLSVVFGSVSLFGFLSVTVWFSCPVKVSTKISPITLSLSQVNIPCRGSFPSSICSLSNSEVYPQYSFLPLPRIESYKPKYQSRKKPFTTLLKTFVFQHPPEEVVMTKSPRVPSPVQVTTVRKPTQTSYPSSSPFSFLMVPPGPLNPTLQVGE